MDFMKMTDDPYFNDDQVYFPEIIASNAASATRRQTLGHPIPQLTPEDKSK